MAVDIILTLALITPQGPYLYRLAFQPLEQAPVLTLLIASVGVYLAFTVLGLVYFGPEGMEGDALLDTTFDLGGVTVTGQSAIMFAASVVLMVLLFLFFERTLYGKAMRAVAVNRTGARLVGIPISMSGQFAFLLSSLIGAISGVLIGPVTMVYYDSGFLIGLIGFVAAIVGGMGSYPLSVLGAIFVGQIQSFAGFLDSKYQYVIMFAALIPVLILRSLRQPPVEDEE
jgi:branched-chain amino acid transport system permease protein